MVSLDNISTLCIPIVAAILGIAFPIIIQTISQIDTKYNSVRLDQRFRKESLYKQLWISLIIAIVALLYKNFLFYPWKYEDGFFNWLMSNSSNIIVLLSTLYLIAILFSVVNLIIRYSDNKDLFHRILKRTKKKEKINKDDIQDLTELVKYILPKDDNDTLRAFYKLLYEYTSGKSKNGIKQVFEYDEWFYKTILSLHETICKESIHSSSIINENDIIKILIPESSNSIISDKTYFVLWRALQQQLIHNKTEWVYNYWSFAHQHIWLGLKPIWAEYDYSTKGILSILNKVEVEIREAQINRFKEFHLVLIGYILYLKKYSLIKQITSYSQSEPYQFPLVPSTLVDIVKAFEMLSNKALEQSWYFEQYYPFIGIKGVNSTNIPAAWSMSYLSLLLFRLNSFEAKYMASYLDPWELPAIPEKLNEKSALLSTTEQMIRFVEEWNQKENLLVLEELGWNIKDDDIDPLKKLNVYLGELKEAIIEKRKVLSSSKEKLDKFNRRTKEIIENNAVVYTDVLDKCSHDFTNLDKDIINSSLSQKMEKETLSDDQTYTHINYDEVMALIMMDEFIHLYSLSFYKHKKRHYTINSEEMFSALDRLIGDKRDDYAIINFGIYLDFYLDGSQKQPALNKVIGGSNKYEKFYYKDNLTIHSLPLVGNGLMDQVLVIIKKDDLPCYENYKPTDEIISNSTFASSN